MTLEGLSGVLWYHGIVMLWTNQKPELKLQGFHSVMCVRVGVQQTISVSSPRSYYRPLEFARWSSAAGVRPLVLFWWSESQSAGRPRRVSAVCLWAADSDAFRAAGQTLSQCLHTLPSLSSVTAVQRSSRIWRRRHRMKGGGGNCRRCSDENSPLPFYWKHCP